MLGQTRKNGMFYFYEVPEMGCFIEVKVRTEVTGDLVVGHRDDNDLLSNGISVWDYEKVLE